MEWDTGLLLVLEEDGQDTKEYIRLERNGMGHRVIVVAGGGRTGHERID